MRTITFGFPKITTLKLYQDIDETPVEQWNLYNEFALRDSEIGSTMQDIYKRYGTLAALIKSKQTDKAITEMDNLFQTYWSAMNGINFQSLQFGCMIFSINNDPIEDYSEDNLKKVLGDLSKRGLTMKLVKQEIEEVKKKFRFNWS